VPAAQYHLIGFERRDEPGDDVVYGLAPLFLAAPFEAASTHVVFVCSLAIGQVPELHGLDDSMDNKRRAKTGSQPEKQHFASLVAAQRLHRRIVDDFDGAAEGSLIVEPGPACGQVVWLGDNSALHNQSWVTDRDGVVVPILGKLLDGLHHPLGVQGWSG